MKIFFRYRTPLLIASLVACFLGSGIGLHRATAQRKANSTFDLSGVVYPEGIDWIEQDAQGFLWMATRHGVLRSDGLRHQWIFKDETLRITALRVLDGQVYVGCESGDLITIDIKRRSVNQKLSLGNSAITCFERTADGIVYFGTRDQGLGWTDPQGVYYLSAYRADFDLSVHGVAHWNQRLYVATDRGIFVIPHHRLTEAYVLDPAGDQLGDQLINAMVCHGSALFVAGQNGSVTKIYSDDRIEVAHHFNNWHHSSVVLLALYDQQLLVVDDQSDAFCIEIDNLSRIWPLERNSEEQQDVPTDVQVNSQGLLMLARGLPELQTLDLIQTQYNLHDGVSLSNVHALMLSKDRTLWLANSEGLFAHNADFVDGQLMRKMIQSTSDIHFVALAELSGDRIIAGSFGNGLYALNRSTGQVTNIKEADGLINNHITSIEVEDQRIWITTLGGLSCLNATTLQVMANFGASSALGASYLYCSKIDASGDLWIAADGKGLIRYRQGQFEPMRTRIPELSKSISQIQMGRKGQIWLLSLDKGIQCIEQEHLTVHPKLSNTTLGDVVAMAVLEDDRLLVHSARGIYLYDPSRSFLVMVNDDRNTGSEGFQTLVIDNQQQRAWLARAHDLWSCDLDAYTKKHVPDVRLDGILQSLSPIQEGQIEFDSDQNHFTFLLSVPWYVPNEIPTLQYRLLGLDSHWVQTQERSLNYPQLAPGNYRLEVRVLMQNDASVTLPIAYDFAILQPLYKRWWFIAIIVGCLGILGWTITKWRLRQLQSRAMIRQRQLEGELQVLRSQINPHFLFNSFNTLSYTIEKDQQEAVEYVEQLSDYFRLVLQRTEEPLIHLQDELALVEHYIYLQKKRFGDLFVAQMEVPAIFGSWWIPPMVTQIIVENAVKHNVISRERPLLVRIYVEENNLIIENNISAMIKKPEGTGTGLYNIQRRIEILTQRPMRVDNGPHFFVVHVPLLEHYPSND